MSGNRNLYPSIMSKDTTSVALVTGTSSGLGRAVAERLVELAAQICPTNCIGAAEEPLPAIGTPVGPAAAARSFLSVQGQFSGGVWLARQSADFAEEPLEGPDLVAQCSPPFRGDLYPGAWAAIARCLGLGNKAGLFQRLQVPAEVAVGNTERRLQVLDVGFSETAQRREDAEPYPLCLLYTSDAADE